MFHLLLLTLLLLKPDAPAMRLADPAVFVPPPIETQVEYFPPRQQFAVEIVHVITDRPVEGTTAGEMLAKIEEMKRTTGVGHFAKARLVTGEGIRCRERRGYEARCDDTGRITTRSLITASRHDDPPNPSEEWMFVGQTFEAKPFFDDKHRLSVELRCQLKTATPVTSIKTSHARQTWCMGFKTAGCQSTVSLTENEYVSVGGVLISEEDELMPDGNRVRSPRMNHTFVKVCPLRDDEK
jgi:hypothetical protein